MTPPEAPDRDTAAAGAPRAASPFPHGSSLEVLTVRPQFLAAARGLRAGTAGLNLQGRDRGDGGGVRYGVTATKKVGNAVARNRAKRRLRAIARDLLAAEGRQGWDYVLVARPDATVSRPFDDLRADLVHALRRLHARSAGEG